MFVYVERLEKVTPPSEFANAGIYIVCGDKFKDKQGNKPWDLSADTYKLAKGFSYKVKADGVWSDDKGTAWHGGEITLNIKCPGGIIGSLYVYFEDWNKQNRKGTITFEGREYILDDHKDGKWVKLHIMREDSNDENLTLKCNVKTGGNLMISKIALVEE